MTYGCCSSSELFDEKWFLRYLLEIAEGRTNFTPNGLQHTNEQLFW